MKTELEKLQGWIDNQKDLIAINISPGNTKFATVESVAREINEMLQAPNVEDKELV